MTQHININKIFLINLLVVNNWEVALGVVGRQGPENTARIREP